MSDLHIFTKEEKDACLPIIDYLIYCSNVVRSEGILALENRFETHKNFFLRLLLQQITDGVYPELVKSMATTLIDAENHVGTALLERRIIADGVTMIQAGENPRIIEIKLLCHLGEDYLLERGIANPSYKPPLITFENLLNEAPLQECIFFDNIIQIINNRDLQCVLQFTDPEDIVIALNGCGRIAAKKIGDNLTERLQTRIAGDLKYNEPPELSSILKSQDKISNAMRRMSESGEIVSPTKFFVNAGLHLL